MRLRVMTASIGVLATLGLPSAVLAAAPMDGSAPLLCALNSVVECSRQGDCERTTTEEAEMPPFVRIDVPKRLLSSVDGARTSPIVTVQRANGRLMLQGMQNERVWGAVIDEGSGRMTATVGEDDGAFVIAGACIAP